MKRFLILLLTISTFAIAFAQETKPKNDCKDPAEQVYICNGPRSARYHKISNCRGLSKCTTQIEKLCKSEAIKKGRTACKICYKQK